MIRGTGHATTAEGRICRLQEADAAALASKHAWHTCSKSQHQLIKGDGERDGPGQGWAVAGVWDNCVSGTAFTYNSLKPACNFTQNSTDQALKHRPLDCNNLLKQALASYQHSMAVYRSKGCEVTVQDKQLKVSPELMPEVRSLVMQEGSQCSNRLLFTGTATLLLMLAVGPHLMPM